MRVYGITGRKNSGKTTLAERLVAAITARGFSVSTVKHSHQSADIDQPGRDTYRHREAGATEVLLTSSRRWALMHELRGGEEPDLAQHLSRFERVDLVLIEGFKDSPHPKIETIRAATRTTSLAPTNPTIRAIASDHSDPQLNLPDDRTLPVFDLNDIPAIAHFIIQETGLDRVRRTSPSMPPRVDGTPVDQVLGHLRSSIAPIDGSQILPLTEAVGHVLAEDAVVYGSHPPAANSAVGGYGYAFDTVDFNAGPRRAGADKKAGEVALKAGTVLRALDIGLAAALVIRSVIVRPKLRVGVLSVGEELVDHDQANAPLGRIPDANRLMLLSVLGRLGYAAVDLGIVRDDRAQIRSALDVAVGQVDAILTSGGGAEGDAGYVSRFLRDEAQLQDWCVAIKPGRRLVLAHWKGVPVFGLPGNPVAAMICTVVFALPALSLRAGAGWHEARGFMAPSDFSKVKLAGRREFLRARLTVEGRVEVFPSEGSGRIKGLSWADGLVDLPDGVCEIQPGDPVRYIPWTACGF